MKDSEVFMLDVHGTIDGNDWFFYAHRKEWTFKVFDGDDVSPMYCDSVPLTEPLSVGELSTVISHAKSRYYASIGKGKYA